MEKIRGLKKRLGPERVLDISTGYMSAKVLMAANKLDLFSELAKGPLESEELRRRLALHERGATDFFDALVSLGLLRRNGLVYSNAPEAGRFLDRAKPSYIGGILELDDTHLYGPWGKLVDALRSGKPQISPEESQEFFDAIYRNKAKLKTFLSAMTGVSIGSAQIIAAEFPWSDYDSFVDIGTAQGCLPVQIALAHRHLNGAGFDLRVVKPLFMEYVRSFGLEHRLRFVTGDFFKDEFPVTEVLVMGHILHDWNLEKKRFLIKKAFKALPKDGALIVYESVLDDQRRSNVGGFLASLNMLVLTQGGFEYTYKDCSGWMCEAGFRRTYAKHLSGPKSMIVGIK